MWSGIQSRREKSQWLHISSWCSGKLYIEKPLQFVPTMDQLDRCFTRASSLGRAVRKWTSQSWNLTSLWRFLYVFVYRARSVTSTTDDHYLMQGCTHEESHTEEAVVQVQPPKAASNANLTMKESDAGKEVYSSGNATPTQTLGIAPAVVVPPVEIIEEEDDLNVPVTVGEKCRRAGCGTIFVSNDVNRNGDGEGTVCTYHPKPVRLVLRVECSNTEWDYRSHILEKAARYVTHLDFFVLQQYRTLRLFTGIFVL